MPLKKELTGWKAIADYLEVSTRTAQQREKDQGLPIRHELGTKGRVYAEIDELEAWRRRTRSSGGPQNELNSQRPSPVSSSPTRSRVVWAIALTVAALFVASAYLLIPHGPLSDYRVEGKNLILVNAKGQELWRHTFDIPLRDGAYSGDQKLARGLIEDITGDGRPEFLFVAWPMNQDDVGSTVMCFAEDGRIKWRFKPGRPVTEGSGEDLLPPYTTNGVRLFLGRTPAETRIAVSSLHWLREPAQVAFLDRFGVVVGEYWHPGHFNHVASADLDKDGHWR